MYKPVRLRTILRSFLPCCLKQFNDLSSVRCPFGVVLSTRLELTADGVKAYELARPDIAAGFEEVSRALSVDEARTALEPLEKLYTRISEINLEERKR